MKGKKTKKSKSKVIIEPKKSSHKGQAMMEYLMTYGLALFVILVVLAILVAVVLPSLKPPSTCQFTQPGFSCNQKAHRILSDGTTVDIVFRLDNQFGRNVAVTAVGCANRGTAEIGRSDADVTLSPPNGLTIVAGSGTELGTTAVPIRCNGADPAVNSNFKGSVIVLYKFADEVGATTLPPRVAVATVSGTVESRT